MRTIHIIAASALVSGLAMNAHASKYDDSIQCVGMINVVTAGWPAEHPSTVQAKELATGWTDYAAALSGAPSDKLEADIAASVAEIQAYAISVKGNEAQMQSYFAPISARCETVPEMPVAAGVCRNIAEGEFAGAEMDYNMNAYNQAFASGDELIETRQQMVAAEERKEQAQSAMNYFSDAPSLTAEQLLELLERSPEERSALLDTCLTQMD